MNTSAGKMDTVVHIKTQLIHIPGNTDVKNFRLRDLACGKEEIIIQHCYHVKMILVRNFVCKYDTGLQ